MAKEFNKEVFQKQQNKILLYCIIIGAIAIVSIILSFFINSGSSMVNSFKNGEYINGWQTGKNLDKGNDPKDYYGTYYFTKDCAFYTIQFTEKECKYTTSNGLKGNGTTDSYVYEYVSKEYAHEVFNTDSYKDSDAILMYIDKTENQAIIFWVVDTKPYKFVMGSTGVTVSDNANIFAETMGDSKDYLGTYEYETHKVTFYENGKASFLFNGVENMFSYSFVNKTWLSKYLGKDFEFALLLYNEGEANCKVFQRINNKKLLYGTYEFNKCDNGNSGQN